MGLPKASLSLQYASVVANTASAPASAVAPMARRSLGRFCISATNPPPSSPSRLPAGTRTSLKNSSEVSWACMPTLSRLRPRSKPAMPRSTTSRLIPR